MKTLGSWDSENGPTWNVEFRDLDEQLRFLRKMVSGPQVVVNGKLIGDYRTHPKIRELALTIIKSKVAPRDKKSQALAIGQWVQDNIYYVHEMPERFQTPIETLRLAAGDCDDSTVLVCSLLETIGIPSNLVCMQINGVWKHIFPAAVMQNGALLPLDSTLKDYPVDTATNPTMLTIAQGKQVRIKLA
jgi:transglutaminase-like putative cysteine protease